MKKKLKLFLVIIVILDIQLFISCGPGRCNNSNIDKGQIKIEWVDSLTGDFSFQHQWDYPEGIYKNEFGQLCCDGLCPELTYAMMDSYGKVFNDSLDAYYRLVDTTRQFHSIQCEAWCYEWAGTDNITVREKSKDSIECFTSMNAATHCSLHFDILNNFCYPRIELNSIAPSGNKVYKCNNGFVKIDKYLWKQGILKAEFNFYFHHTENPDQQIYWKGKTYAIFEKN